MKRIHYILERICVRSLGRVYHHRDDWNSYVDWNSLLNLVSPFEFAIRNLVYPRI